MNINRNIYSFLIGIFVLLVSVTAYSESLSEISSFANTLCDEIKAQGSTSKTKIIASLNGNLAPISKLVGAHVGANGKIELENSKYNGLPFDAISEQMIDSRSCKTTLALAILEGRYKVEKSQSNSGLESKYVINTAKQAAILVGSPDFKYYFELISSGSNKLISLYQNTPISLIGRQYSEKQIQGAVKWQKIRVLAGQFKGEVGWILADNVSFK